MHGKTRPGLAAALLLAGAAMGIAGETGAPGGLALTVVGLTLAAFVSIVGAASYASLAWGEEAQALGRRAGGATLLVGAGAGVATLGIIHATLAVLHDQDVSWPLVGTALGAIACLIGSDALATRRPSLRVTLTLGTLAATAGAILLPWPPAAGLIGALCLLILLQTWTRAPVTASA